MKDYINKLLVSALMLACLFFTSCNDDNDYVNGEVGDTVAEWTISNPSAHLTLLIDEMPADGFYEANTYKNFRTTAKIDKLDGDKTTIQFADNSFTDMFGLPSTMQLNKGEDFSYTSGTFQNPVVLKLHAPVSVGNYLPTLGGVLQGVITSLASSGAAISPALGEYLKNFNILDQQVGDMTLELSSYYFSVDMQHNATALKGFATMKARIKEFKFYGADANLINQFMPMLVESDLFQQMNEFNLKVAFDFNK